MIVGLTVWALPVVLAVTLHEAAHGYVANVLGDDTAKRAGRLTLNPIAHIDPFGTVVLPLIMLLVSSGGFMFGYAKPVPVNFGRLHKPRRDMVLVAAAGPGANFAIAIVSALLLHIGLAVPGVIGEWMMETLAKSIYFNCIIAIFNLMPVPPLDGGRVATGLLPLPLGRQLARIEPMGLLIIVGVFFLLPMLMRSLGIGFNPAYPLIILPSLELMELFLQMAGFRS